MRELKVARDAALKAEPLGGCPPVARQEAQQKHPDEPREQYARMKVPMAAQSVPEPGCSGASAELRQLAELTAEPSERAAQADAEHRKE